MNRQKIITVLTGIFLLAFILGGCGQLESSDSGNQSSDIETSDIEISETDTPETETLETETFETETPETETLDTEALGDNNEGDTFTFVDVFGEEYEAVINPDVPSKTYDDDCFRHDGYYLYYEDGLAEDDDEHISSRLGIDVSNYQGNINWARVKEAGYEFAFIRIGYRGYGQYGNLCTDKKYRQNIEGAKENGLDVGVYFFAQAINEQEAIEEAEYVLSLLEGYELTLPVVYDPESILDDVARTDDVTGEQFTLNTIAFCNTIADAGYEPAVYANMLWEAFELDLSKLDKIPVWYADYEAKPQTPYDFEYWQYSNTARVDGVDGECDVDIQMIKTNQ